ncbi:hypothetical protein HU200_046875 [Digitaria exilis]|uniref:Serine/threonine-protein kinase 19 n=1 Tax=Digitaria exilis TaxID=1010633 RepID=A0A835AXX3_9POAL|nr:hypothetical protein HU200_064811 [Digitaria exilis]KAF8676695.1 hypothetical protein HU200_046875 [Digitaria exilis]
MTEPSSSYSLSSKKRPRSPNDNGEHPLDRDQICPSLGASDDAEENLTFNDTMIALQLMRTQFPKLEKVVVQPFILQSQLYSSVKDRTQVDRDLENFRVNMMLKDASLLVLQSFKKDKMLRIFKLSSGQDDHAIMFLDDYLKQVAFAIKRSGGKEQDGSEVFDWFEKYVIPSKLDVSINHIVTLKSLSLQCSLLSQGGDVTDKHITLLMNAGLLVSNFPYYCSRSLSFIEFETRQLIDPNIYWFSIPRIGPILKGLSQGRKEILSLLNRKKYKEMLLSSLEKTKLRLSPLDTRFLIRDLIGSGQIKTVQTPTGLLARITRD